MAYSSASELDESAKMMGMNDMRCMRLLLDLTELMGMMNPEDLEDGDGDAF